MCELEKYLNSIDVKYLFGIIIDDNINEMCRTECGSLLNIPTNFYTENKVLFDAFFKKFYSFESKDRYIFICSPLFMTDAFVNIIKNNKSIYSVNIFNHKLTMDEFNQFCENESIKEINSDDVSDEFNDFYDKRFTNLRHTRFNQYVSVYNLLYDDRLFLCGKFDKNDVDYMAKLLNLRDGFGRICFHFDKDTDSKIYKKLLDAVYERYIDKNDKADFTKFNIEFSYSDSKYVDCSLFDNELENKLVKIRPKNDDEYDLNKFILIRNIISNLFGQYFENLDKLSPLERILWLYQIVSTYKEYKLEITKEDWRDSRLLSKLLFTDKICCVGFAYLLEYVSNNSNLKVISEKASSVPDKFDHMLNLIKLDDDKYDIHGIYLLDSCFDNSNDKDCFLLNHFLINLEKYKKHFMNMRTAGYEFIGNISEENFIEKLNNDDAFCSSVYNLIHLNYPDYEFFHLAFSSPEFYRIEWLNRGSELYKMFNNINTSEIDVSVIGKALCNIEKIKNPNMGNEEIAEKVGNIMNKYNERNSKIYNKEEKTYINQ